jgi:hypothetical protein
VKIKRSKIKKIARYILSENKNLEQVKKAVNNINYKADDKELLMSSLTDAVYFIYQYLEEMESKKSLS